MQLLTATQVLLVSGAQDPDDVFNGIVFGAVTGFLIGSLGSVRLVCKYPLLVALPGMVENVATLGAITGACIGGIAGGLTAALMEDN